MTIGFVTLLAAGQAGDTDPTDTTTTSAPASPLTPGPWSARSVAVAAQDPTRRAQARRPFVLGAGLTRAEATSRAAHILREEHPDGTVDGDLDGWPNLVRVRSTQPPPDTLSSRLMDELGVQMPAFTPPSPRPTT